MVTIDGKGLLSAIGAVVAAASFNVGCLSPNSVTCSDGRVCPVGTACDEVKHLCFTPAALAACAGAAEGDDCVVSQVLGTCHSGGCRLGDSVWSATAAIGAVGAVWAREPDDAYAVGPSWWATGNTPGAFSHWDGTRWSPVSDGGSDAVLAVGGSVIIRSDSFTWSGAGSGIVGFWGVSPEDIFAVSWFPNALSHWDGNSWSTLWTNNSVNVIVPPDFLNGVWATGSDVFVVGFGIGHWDGAVMTPADMSKVGSDSWNGVWGSGRDDVYAVGDGGAIAHWNGASWSRMTSGTTGRLLAVHGSSAGDVFAGGDDILLHLHNGAWEPIYLGGFTTIRALWVTPRRVFVGGDEGEIHLDRPR